MGGQIQEFNLERNNLSQEEQLVQGSLAISLMIVDPTRCLMASYETYSKRFHHYAEMDPHMTTRRARDTGSLVGLAAKAMNNLTTIEDGVKYVEQQGALQPMVKLLEKHPDLTGHAIECLEAFQNVVSKNTMRDGVKYVEQQGA